MKGLVVKMNTTDTQNMLKQLYTFWKIPACKGQNSYTSGVVLILKTALHDKILNRFVRKFSWELAQSSD